MDYYQRVPFFAAQWYTDLCHDRLNDLKLMDQPLLDLLHYMGPILDKTVFFLMADHGFKYGDIRRTPVGRLGLFSLVVHRKRE